MNTIGDIHNFKILNICLFEEIINADVFYAWIVHHLMPSLPERAVIVADNTAFHKRADWLEAIRVLEYELLFMHPYCLDLNHIEKK